MKLTPLCCFLLVFCINDYSYGQIPNDLTQFRETFQLINPAATGFKIFGYDYRHQDRPQLAGGFIHRFIGVKGLSRDEFSSAIAWGEYQFRNLPWSSKHRAGLGLATRIDRAGLLNETEISMSSTYQILLNQTSKNEHRLSLGFTVNYIRHSLEIGELPIEEQNLSGIIGNDNTLNLNVGVFYTNDDFYAGFSMSDILENSPQFGLYGQSVEIGTVYNVLAGGYIPLKQKVFLELTGWGRLGKEISQSIDLIIRGHISLSENNGFWVGMGGRWINNSHYDNIEVDPSRIIITPELGVVIGGENFRVKLSGAFLLNPFESQENFKYNVTDTQVAFSGR